MRLNSSFPIRTPRPRRRAPRFADPAYGRSRAGAVLALTVPVCLLVSAARAEAATLPERVAPVVISAAAFPQPLNQTLPTVSVITRKQIRRSGVKNLTTLLQRIAGVQVTASGGPGQPATTYLEGFGGIDAGVLVLLNGVPITAEDASGGGDYLENLTTDQIQRIEVVHGNVSAIYGSGAIGGVILITTRTGSRTPHAQVSVSGGSRATVTTSANISGQIHATRLQLGVSRYTTAGIPSINPAQSPFVTSNRSDGYHNLTLNGSIVQALAPHQQLGVRGFMSDGHYSYDNDTTGGRTRQSLIQLFSNNRLTRRWTSHLSLSRQTTTDVNLGSFASSYRSTHLDVSWRNVARLSANWTLTGGADWQHQSVASTGEGGIPHATRNVVAFFAGINGTFRGNDLQLNLRHDHFSGYADSKNTFFVGYGRQLGNGLKLIASYASAFNAPPLGYLYYSSPGYWAANPQLQPESAHTVQAALQWSGHWTLVRATVFQTTGSDLWGYGTTAGGLTQFQNIARTRTRGLELSARGAWRRLSYDANLTLQQPLALSEPGSPTLQRLAHSIGNLSVQYNFGRFWTGVLLHYTGPRPDVAYTPTFATEPVTLGSYTTVTLTAGGPISATLRWNARAQNLFDKRYETAYGYNSLPFGFFVGLTWRPF